MRFSSIILALLVAGFAAYVRFAPVSVAAFHAQTTPRAPGDEAAPGRFVSVRAITATPDEVLTAVVAVAAATDRTKMVAGSVAEGMITFETRSKVWGFPDYTTVSFIPVGTVGNDADLVMIDGRLRFGSYDLDVNKTRIEAWLAALGPLTVPLDSATSGA